MCGAATATSIVRQHREAKDAGLTTVDRGLEAAVADAVTPASVQQLRGDILSVIQEMTGRDC